MSDYTFRVLTVIALWTIIGQLLIFSIAIGQFR